MKPAGYKVAAYAMRSRASYDDECSFADEIAVSRHGALLRTSLDEHLLRRCLLIYAAAELQTQNYA